MDSSKVKINSNANTGVLHRAISLSEKLHKAGAWDGFSPIVWESAQVVNEAIAEYQLTGQLPTTGFTV